ncbi:MAG: trypsin-like peptidase domain-containing protein [Nisaea sp.]|uniref:S1 family peptidase n=1 Tax=Nisaea sp. TaxID=2024842 RepID=UPI001AFDA02D|nr:serine protease [Nisaea sp.]MBO6561468.1 trypsin-like peptidase domain-containing protein [Nisaea sp.]
MKKLSVILYILIFFANFAAPNAGNAFEVCDSGESDPRLRDRFYQSANSWLVKFFEQRRPIANSRNGLSDSQISKDVPIGHGVIISGRGHTLTALHVVENKDFNKLIARNALGHEFRLERGFLKSAPSAHEIVREAAIIRLTPSEQSSDNGYASWATPLLRLGIMDGGEANRSGNEALNARNLFLDTLKPQHDRIQTKTETIVYENNRRFRFNQSMERGFSGSPVFDCRFNLVGILTQANSRTDQSEMIYIDDYYDLLILNRINFLPPKKLQPTIYHNRISELQQYFLNMRDEFFPVLSEFVHLKSSYDSLQDFYAYGDRDSDYYSTIKNNREIIYKTVDIEGVPERYVVFSFTKKLELQYDIDEVSMDLCLNLKNPAAKHVSDKEGCSEGIPVPAWAIFKPEVEMFRGKTNFIKAISVHDIKSQIKKSTFRENRFIPNKRDQIKEEDVTGVTFTLTVYHDGQKRHEEVSALMKNLGMSDFEKRIPWQQSTYRWITPIDYIFPR